jgi:hypothetical protein
MPTDSSIGPTAPPDTPPRLWDRQPGESARDYLDFVAWLECPVRRPMRAAAARLNVSARRLRTLSARHRWRARALACDEHRAETARTVLEQHSQDAARSLEDRAQLFREQEWLLHEAMLEQARAALRGIRITRRRIPSLHSIARLLELASVLGRRACGLPVDGECVKRPPSLPSSDFEDAIQKIYGEPANGPEEAGCPVLNQDLTPDNLPP